MVPASKAVLVLALVFTMCACRRPAEKEGGSDLIMALQETEVTLEDFRHWVQRNVSNTCIGIILARQL